MARSSSKPSTGRSLWERQRDAIRQSKAEAAAAPTEPRYTFPPFVPAPAAPQPAPGAYRIEQLRLGQCRFACTADDAPRNDHRFCGAPTEIGPRNLYGSWCPEHLAVVGETTSRLAQPTFLKNAARSGSCHVELPP